MESNIAEPLNLGSSELVSINQLVDIAESIGGVKLKRNTSLMPQGRVTAATRQYADPETAGLGTVDQTAGRSGKNYRWIHDQIATNARCRCIDRPCAVP